jgi:hypothetical protein
VVIVPQRADGRMCLRPGRSGTATAAPDGSGPASKSAKTGSAWWVMVGGSAVTHVACCRSPGPRHAHAHGAHSPSLARCAQPPSQ